MTGQIGPRGLAILVLAGIAGILLAILGWSQRGTGLGAPSVGGLAILVAARTSAPQPLPPARFYASGGRAYTLTSNLGYDGLIVTDQQGRTVP